MQGKQTILELDIVSFKGEEYLENTYRDAVVSYLLYLKKMEKRNATKQEERRMGLMMMKNEHTYEEEKRGKDDKIRLYFFEI